MPSTREPLDTVLPGPGTLPTNTVTAQSLQFSLGGNGGDGGALDSHINNPAAHPASAIYIDPPFSGSWSAVDNVQTALEDLIAASGTKLIWVVDTAGTDGDFTGASAFTNAVTAWTASTVKPIIALRPGTHIWDDSIALTDIQIWGMGNTTILSSATNLRIGSNTQFINFAISPTNTLSFTGVNALFRRIGASTTINTVSLLGNSNVIEHSSFSTVTTNFDLNGSLNRIHNTSIGVNGAFRVIGDNNTIGSSRVYSNAGTIELSGRFGTILNSYLEHYNALILNGQDCLVEGCQINNTHGTGIQLGGVDNAVNKIDFTTTTGSIQLTGSRTTLKAITLTTGITANASITVGSTDSFLENIQFLTAASSSNLLRLTGSNNQINGIVIGGVTGLGGAVVAVQGDSNVIRGINGIAANTYGYPFLSVSSNLNRIQEVRINNGTFTAVSPVVVTGTSNVLEGIRVQSVVSQSVIECNGSSNTIKSISLATISPAASILLISGTDNLIDTVRILSLSTLGGDRVVLGGTLNTLKGLYDTSTSSFGYSVVSVTGDSCTVEYLRVNGVRTSSLPIVSVTGTGFTGTNLNGTDVQSPFLLGIGDGGKVKGIEVTGSTDYLVNWTGINTSIDDLTASSFTYSGTAGIIQLYSTDNSALGDGAVSGTNLNVLSSSISNTNAAGILLSGAKARDITFHSISSDGALLRLTGVGSDARTIHAYGIVHNSGASSLKAIDIQSATNAVVDGVVLSGWSNAVSNASTIVIGTSSGVGINNLTTKGVSISGSVPFLTGAGQSRGVSLRNWDLSGYTKSTPNSIIEISTTGFQDIGIYDSIIGFSATTETNLAVTGVTSNSALGVFSVKIYNCSFAISSAVTAYPTFEVTSNAKVVVRDSRIYGNALSAASTGNAAVLILNSPFCTFHNCEIRTNKGRAMTVSNSGGGIYNTTLWGGDDATDTIDKMLGIFSSYVAEDDPQHDKVSPWWIRDCIFELGFANMSNPTAVNQTYPTVVMGSVIDGKVQGVPVSVDGLIIRARREGNSATSWPIRATLAINAANIRNLPSGRDGDYVPQYRNIEINCADLGWTLGGDSLGWFSGFSGSNVQYNVHDTLTQAAILEVLGSDQSYRYSPVTLENIRIIGTPRKGGGNRSLIKAKNIEINGLYLEGADAEIGGTSTYSQELIILTNSTLRNLKAWGRGSLMVGNNGWIGLYNSKMIGGTFGALSTTTTYSNYCVALHGSSTVEGLRAELGTSALFTAINCDGSYNTVRNCEITYSGGSMTQYIAFQANSDTGIAEGNRLTYSGTSNISLVCMRGYASCSNLVFRNNFGTFTTNPQNPIYFIQTDGGSNTIQGNRALSLSQQLRIYSNGEDAFITDNYLNFNHLGTLVYNNFQIVGNYAVFTGNKVANFGSSSGSNFCSGSMLVNGAYSTVCNNHIRGHDSNGGSNCAVLNVPGQNCTISGNIIINDSQAGAGVITQHSSSKPTPSSSFNVT